MPRAEYKEEDGQGSEGNSPADGDEDSDEDEQKNHTADNGNQQHCGISSISNDRGRN